MLTNKTRSTLAGLTFLVLLVLIFALTYPLGSMAKEIIGPEHPVLRGFASLAAGGLGGVLIYGAFLFIVGLNWPGHMDGCGCWGCQHWRKT